MFFLVFLFTVAKYVSNLSIYELFSSFSNLTNIYDIPSQSQYVFTPRSLDSIPSPFLKFFPASTLFSAISARLYAYNISHGRSVLRSYYKALRFTMNSEGLKLDP